MGLLPLPGGDRAAQTQLTALWSFCSQLHCWETDRQTLTEKGSRKKQRERETQGQREELGGRTDRQRLRAV